ncbi:hypothetical protein HDV00_001212 [Rhizophlyctis rosea]|nr:hypothetical protein HDV00_001212 [Rhizophlyctis rosea]
MTDPGPLLVIIHGAQHTPSHWHTFVRDLQKRQIFVEYPAMPSTAPSKTDFNPANLGDLHADTAALHSVVASYSNRNVIVLAHSFAGLCAVQACSLPNIKHIIFLTAGIPKPGSSLGATMQELASRFPEGASDFNFENLTVRVKDVDLTIDTLYNPSQRLNPTVRKFVERMHPFSLKSYNQVPDYLSYEHVPSTYIVCTGDRAMSGDIQKLMAGWAGSEVVEVDETHCGFLVNPARVVDIVEKIVKKY